MCLSNHRTYPISSHWIIFWVRPPQNITVTMTMNDVVVSMSCLALVEVFRMAKANAIAPRSPEKNIKCCMFFSIFLFAGREILMRKDNG